eukprot:TRINITY_DN12186_c0_g1::TRINITY_DN12186_c0_g1_i1::g.26628::m.26628 TRINITY_DN12186_c0_g1::TRINITY_DN12186_c0_g1_i1::g.26628  ORF type:complete len:142 (-),score=6.01,zf-HIT/PF04438.11/1.2,zf-HIT/PF04438.11/3.1e+03,zf-HIT/PF04438.11/1.1e+02 TRINITY_DN12186_c0_g1_i1:157-582(-)
MASGDSAVAATAFGSCSSTSHSASLAPHASSDRKSDARYCSNACVTPASVICIAIGVIEATSLIASSIASSTSSLLMPECSLAISSETMTPMTPLCSTTCALNPSTDPGWGFAPLSVITRVSASRQMMKHSTARAALSCTS